MKPKRGVTIGDPSKGSITIVSVPAFGPDDPPLLSTFRRGDRVQLRDESSSEIFIVLEGTRKNAEDVWFVTLHSPRQDKSLDVLASKLMFAPYEDAD